MANAPQKIIADEPAPAPIGPRQEDLVAAEASSPAANDPVAAPSPVTEIQQNVGAALEKGVVKSRVAFMTAKASADQAASAIEVSFAAAKDGVLAINAKAFEALRANAEANIDFVKALFASKSLSERIALQSEFAGKRVDAMTGQAKDIGTLAQSAVTETVRPIKEQVAKSFKIAV